MNRSNLLMGFAALLIVSCGNASGNGSGSAAAGGAMGSGSDMYYEYVSHTVGPNMTMNSLSKIYLTADGKMRKEMQISNPAKPDKTSPIIAIGSADKPMQSITIDDDSKTWSTMDLDSLGVDNDAFHVTSTVTKLDNEKLLGFDCVHVRVISNKDIGGLIKELDTMDLWKSRDVPVPAAFTAILERIETGKGFIYAKDVPAQLKQMVCDGFLVKMQEKNKDVVSVFELTKAEKRDLPKSLFVIPSGYKEDKSGGL